MSLLDAILLLPLVWGLIRGLMKGFILTVGSLVSLLAGIYVANAYVSESVVLLAQWFTLPDRYLYLLAYVLIFTVVVLLGLLVSKLMARFFKALSLAWLDKTLGAVLGFLKYALLVSVVVNLVDLVDVHLHLIERDTKAQSVAYMPLKQLAPGLLPYVRFYLDDFHEATETE